MALISAAIAQTSPAQGTLSTQGLGYPPGQLGTQAASMGGAVGEVDAFSTLNPATISMFRRPTVTFQVEPEYRETLVNGRQVRTSLARFPLFLGAMPMGSQWAAGVSASTLLDRTWETTTRDTQLVSGQPLAATVGRRSDGSIADLRVAVAFTPAPWLRLGLGGHAFSGRDLLRVARRFDDSTRFASDTQATSLSFGGNAVSLGVQMLSHVAGLGVSYRRGGSLHSYAGNQVIGSGSAPDHLGASLVYLGISGTTFGIRIARDSWGRLSGMDTTMHVHEGWDVGIGGDATGPHFGDSPLGVRAGARWRTLPFSVSGVPVKERTLSGGIGLPMAAGAVQLNLGALRATRTSGDITENAWTISTSFSVTVRQ